MKAKHYSQAITLDQIPNIGKGIAKDLRKIGVNRPKHFKGKDPIALFKLLRAEVDPNYDPQTADILMAAVDFMNGGEPKPASSFTEARKKLIK